MLEPIRSSSTENAPYTIVEGPDGNLYGATLEGGNNGGESQFLGYGVLFRVSKTGTGFKVIHRLCSQANCADGSFNIGPLVVGADGNLYGTTSEGGSAQAGTIFRVNPSTGAYAVVHNFSQSGGGFFPNGLTVGADGTFYGITVNGNRLFHFDPGKNAFSSATLPFPSPQGCAGFSCTALGGVSFGPTGDLYGQYTIYDLGGVGLFEVHPDGSSLQLFPEYENGSHAEATNALVLASDENFWSAEYNLVAGPGDLVAVSPSSGTIVQKVTPFSSSAPVGGNPLALVQAVDGTFWDRPTKMAQVSKGHFGGGTVYNLNLGLPPR